MTSSNPHVGMSNRGDNAREDVMWCFWLNGRRGVPDGQIFERSCREAVLKVERCFGSKLTAIQPAGDWGTALDVIEADEYTRKQRKKP